MKFFDFVSCCGNAGRTCRPAMRSDDFPEIPTATTDETRSLVRSPVNRRRRKRGRIGGPSSSSSASSPAEWKPSLCSIAEDHSVSNEKSENRRNIQGIDRNLAIGIGVGSERVVKRKSATRSPRSTNISVYRDDYGRSSFPALIPAFSPTPFMF